MPNWQEVLGEISAQSAQGDSNAVDTIRRKYLEKLHKYTKRHTIAYYSGWLSAGQLTPVHSLNDADKNAFMSMVHGLKNREDTGLDLILHTPGGDIAAAESLVDYLHKMFNGNIRAVIPQISMSAGTMIACACKSIVMGKQSNLGPIDPQINGLPAKSIIDEFNTAIEKITENPNSLPLWQVIIGKYHPSFLTSCQHAVKWSEEMVGTWLEKGMFSEHKNAKQLADAAVSKLSATDENYTHGRHIHMERCKDIGLKLMC